MRSLPRILTTSPAWLAGGICAALLALMSGCGGGVGSGGTGGYVSGPITGFGSVIVSGVRFDDDAAAVEDGDGARRQRDELRLGMTVEVEGSAIVSSSTGSSATASRIRFESELQGLISLADLPGSSLWLLGQRVMVDASTVFDSRLSGGLGGLRAGQGVEVYAVFDSAAAHYRATRIEPWGGLGGLRLRGPLLQIDASAQTLRVGGATYSYTGATGVPQGLAAGQYVRLRLAPELTPVPRWVVQSFGTALQVLPEAEGVKVEGLISAFTSAASFSVNGRAVDATAASFPSGSASLGAGVRVLVEGTVRLGVLRATRVSLLSDDQVRDRGFELIGAISAVNPAQARLTLRGVEVSTARSDLRFEGGSAADLVVGRSIEVRGGLDLERRTVEAWLIRFR